MHDIQIKYKYFFFLLLFLGSTLFAQDTLRLSQDGIELREYYLGLHVEDLWQAGHHIDWLTGIPNDPFAKHGVSTHCSAFAAAACYGLHLYILRPPDHGQELLANAQFEWLASADGNKAGWVRISADDPRDVWMTAQRKANEGIPVVASVENPDPHSPGHIAMVMPSEISTDSITALGPRVIQAGGENHNEVSLKQGFKKHITEWPEKSIWFYFHMNKVSD